MRPSKIQPPPVWIPPLLLALALTAFGPPSARADREVTFITVDQGDEDVERADEALKTYLERHVTLPGGQFRPSRHVYDKVRRILVEWNTELDGPFVARVTPYVYVTAEMLGADLELLGTYESAATEAFVYHSYFVVNRAHLVLAEGETPQLHHLLAWLKTRPEPATFIYHSRLSTSSYFVPSLFFRRNSVFSVMNTTPNGVTVIETDKREGPRGPSSTYLVEQVAAQPIDGPPIFAAVWDGTMKKFEPGGKLQALGEQVYFIRLPEALPNDLLVSSKSLPKETRKEICGLLGAEQSDLPSIGDFKRWLDIDDASEAVKAVSALRWMAREAPAPVTVEVKAAGGEGASSDDHLVLAARQAVRLSGSEFVLYDRDFHKMVDYRWTVALVREGHVSLRSEILESEAEPQEFRISFRAGDLDDLTVRIGELIQSSLDRVRYIWPFEESRPLAIRDVPFSLPSGIDLAVQEISWRNPAINDYTRGDDYRAELEASDYFKFSLATDGIEDVVSMFDPMSNVSYRLILSRPIQPQGWFTFFEVIFWVFMAVSVAGTLIALRGLVRSSPLPEGSRA